ncbi:helix-turn-helix domain-containing protein [Hungatella hathewayi]|uniref:Helix-turn-helix domain-containing protein n=1 Tax=Hungatella hathewayi TaxID=154046 RepID=A0AAW9W9V7_9FIRM|nr:helix-turn-helix transcriptional regulator [Hungatella hathewayi]MUB61543.1 helix-turn-helix domain-containing protein [Hungatella hathewayi]
MNGIGKNIKKLRKESALSQEQLAEQLHVTRQAVSSWETGVSQTKRY